MEKHERESVVDELYYRLYGEHQTKEGQALERLSSVAFKLLEETQKVQYNQQMRARYSGTVYQVDGLIGEGERQVMVEAKDYTRGGDKVGRADLQKLEGALTDLDISEGRFVSATDYTNRAKPYAKSTKKNPKQNPISLFHVRPSVPEDEIRRVKTIQVTIHARGLAFERGEYIPIWDVASLKSIKSGGSTEGIQFRLYQFLDACGEVIETMESITLQLNHLLPEEVENGFVLEGKWKFSVPTYINIPSVGNVRIESLQYKIPTYAIEYSFTINQDGTPVLLVKSEDGTINKMFTDHQLRQFKFEDGEVKRRDGIA